MLRRCAAWRRIQASALTTRQVSIRQIPTTNLRRLSLWPKRWSAVPAQQDLPVYFPRRQVVVRRWIVHSKNGVIRAVLAFAVLYVCFEIYKEFVIIPLLAWADQEYENLSEKEKDELDQMAEDDPGIFLPCPFTKWTEEQPPYQKSDPEWPMFMKARDPKMQKQLSEEICRHVVRYCSLHPQFARFFGKDKDLKIRRVWLDITIPARPPPKHYIAGLIFDDEGIFWGDRPIDTAASNTLNKAVYPKGMATAVYDFFYIIYCMTRDDVKDFFSTDQSPPAVALPGPLIMGAPGQQAPTNAPPKRVVRPAGRPPLVFPNGEDTMTNRLRMAFGYAVARFLVTNKSRKPIRRGCFELEGVASIENQSRAATVAIHAWYDPQSRKFVDAWIVPKRWGNKPK